MKYLMLSVLVSESPTSLKQSLLNFLVPRASLGNRLMGAYACSLPYELFFYTSDKDRGTLHAVLLIRQIFFFL